MTKRYTKQVFVDDDGEYFLELGDIADELGWEVGDTLVWVDNHDGSFTLKKFTREPNQLK
jgi:hypothetical protein